MYIREMYLLAHVSQIILRFNSKRIDFMPCLETYQNKGSTARRDVRKHFRGSRCEIGRDGREKNLRHRKVAAK